MAYPLQDLLRVRLLREELANQHLIKTKNALEEAKEDVKNKEKALEDFKEFRKEEEERLYDNIINKKIKKLDVDEVHSEIEKLKQKELDHEQAILTAEKVVEERKEQVEEARALYRDALANTKKISEHKEMWMEEWKIEQELLAEKEVEEFKAKEMEAF